MAFDYDYSLYQEGIEALVQQILDSNIKFQYVVGIVRGGAIPAVHISHKLDIPCLMIGWQTRDGAVKDTFKALQISHDLSIGKNVLVVDDIADSGRTLAEVIAAIGKHAYCPDPDDGQLKIACLLAKEETAVKPDFCHYWNPEDWVDFWWEKK